MTAAERQAREERMRAREAMLPVLDKLGRGERLSVEERAALDQANTKITELESEIRTYEQARVLSAASAEGDAPAPVVGDVEAREAAFSEYLRRGTQSPELRFAPQGVGTNGAGGFLVPPGWWQRLQVALKAYGGIANDFEQLVTDSGQPLQWATQDPTSTVGTLIGENTAITEVDLTFGQGTLAAYMYTSGVQLVSIQLANDGAFDIDSFIQARVGESLGRAKANAAVAGSGSSQPLGITAALLGKGSVNGATATTASIATPTGSGGFINIGLASKVPFAAADTTTTELIGNTLAPQTLRTMIAGVDPAYRALGAKFYMNDSQLLGARAQVDSNGRPLLNLMDGLTPGAPTTLWGYAIEVDQNIPNLTASTVGGPVFGHLPSAMVCRTVSQSGLLRLDQRYAEFLQVGFIGYMRFDIRSNDLRAAVTVKPAAT